MAASSTYNGNKNLKQIGVPVNYTKKQLEEYARCAADPKYFIRKYVKVVHVDRGTINFDLYGYQERAIDAYHNNRKVIVLAPRQMGKTVTTAAYFLWVVLFNSDKNVAILANKAAVAREILSKIQYAYENLPIWLQQGVKEWNKGSIKLENNSGIITAATSPNAIRGFACSHLYIDEIAFIPTGTAEEFLTSVFPTISSGKETKIFLSSTPKGMNHFYKLWREAESGINGFVPVKVTWDENPTRDLEWLEDQRKNLGELKLAQEVLCVVGETLVTIRNSITGETSTLPIQEVYALNEVLSQFEILTPSGYQKFDGIVKKQADAVLKIKLSNNKEISCTESHVFIFNGLEISAKELIVGNQYDALTVLSIEKILGDVSVYDPVNVANGNLYYSNDITSHNCNFLGSSATLIAGEKIGAIPFIRPMATPIPFLSQYAVPIKDHAYIMTVDVSRGANLDYSTFVIFDISTLPYTVSATYRNNTISTMVYPEVIMKVCMWYNDAYCLIETNDLGQQVADILFYELEYENVYMSVKENIKEGGGSKSSPGIRTTKRTKAIGCDALKNIVENDKIVLNDANILDELSTFVRVGNSYKAEDTKHDDLAMCLVIFAHLTTQPVFKELFSYDLRKSFVGSQLHELDSQFLPLGFVDNGIDELPMTDEERKVPGAFDNWQML